MFAKKFNSSSINVKHTFSFPFKISDKLTFGFTPIKTSKSESLYVEYFVEQKTVNFITCFQIVHLVINIVKGFLIIKTLGFNNEPITFFGVLQFQFWISPIIIMFCLTTFLQRKSTEFVQFFNRVFTLDNIASSFLIKFVVVSSTVISLVMCVSYCILIVFTSLDTIAQFLYSRLNTSTTMYIIVRSFHFLNELWSFAVIYTQMTSLLVAGMFGGYVALGKVAEYIYKGTTNLLPQNFPKHFEEYQKLRLYTVLSNDSYQEIVSIPFKILVIQGGVIFGASLLQSTVRSTANQFEVFFFVYVAVNIYSYIILAYSVPGFVNSISHKIIFTLGLRLTELFTMDILPRPKFKEYKRYVKAYPDIKIMIGAVNYYDKTTWIHILNLVVTYTINLVLMV